mmetsp:Transcript_32021/g.101913  ORF Transcript_32021/g.101913 Transcript_32021/m.101913 type:complete len:154 (-) Transcript_32021:455-916(-)
MTEFSEARQLPRSFAFRDGGGGGPVRVAAIDDDASGDLADAGDAANGALLLRVRVFEVLAESPYCAWPGGKALAAYCVAARADIAGRDVLELGCGVGLPGLTCARLGARRVHLTDLPHPALLAAVKEAAAVRPTPAASSPKAKPKPILPEASS